MKIKTLCLIIFISVSKFCFGQEVKDFTTYSQSLTFDTCLTPNYFKVEVVASEYNVWIGKAKHKVPRKVELDSIKHKLTAILGNLGINNDVVLTKISEASENIYSNEKLLQVSFEFNVGTKDSIEIIYNYISAKLPTSCLKGYKVFPQLTQASITNAQNTLEAIAQEKAKKDAQKFAEKNKLEVKKIETYQISFNLKPNFSDTYFGNSKNINISFVKPLYTLSVYYVFRMQ